jgi:hypothetical protein
MFLFFLDASTHLNMVFLRSKVPFQVVEAGQVVVNHFTLKLTHQGAQTYRVNFEIIETDLKDKIQVVTNFHPAIVDVPEKKMVLFFKFHPQILRNGTRKVTVKAVDDETNETVATKEVTLVGPTH